MNSRRAHFVSVFAFCVGLIAPHAASAAKPSEKSSPETPAVFRVLRAEVAGSVDRRAALQETLGSTSDFATARWQAGFVKDSQSWRSFDAAEAAAAELSALVEYQSRRAAASQTAEGQLELANWCRRQGWPDRERAHLGAVLSLDPEGNHADVLARLGYRQIGGVWLGREQLLEWQKLNRDAEASLKKWGPKLEAIARQLAGGPRQRAAGIDALKKIEETGAVPAIEYSLCGRDEAAALWAIEALGRIAGFESSTALAKQGVFSQWQAVRGGAIERLKSRNLDDFVPQLISLLALPERTEVRVQQLRFGRTRVHQGALLYSFITSRETQDQFQIGAVTTLNSVVDDYLGDRRIGDAPELGLRGLRRGDSPAAFSLARGTNDAERVMREQIASREKAVEERNELALATNQRISTVLATVSGQPAQADPKFWWAWWDNKNDAVNLQSKQTVVVHEFEQIGESNEAPIRHECFIAGTLVWTETGCRPIEQIEIGDRVLSKDVETGKLLFQPVLQTSTRPPKELLTLRLENETLVCTGGHRFWQSGSGWVKARDLSGATLVHTATGNTPVWSTKAGHAQATYNLVVADFHTYFVGQHAVLCQDLLPPKPTNKIVPGLDREQVTAGYWR